MYRHLVTKFFIRPKNISAFSERSFLVSRQKKYQKEYNSHQWNSLCTLTCMGFIGTTTGYLLEDWNSRKKDVSTAKFWLPLSTVHAKDIDTTNYRDKFNFISDIVENTKDGVVAIELYDLKLRHVDPFTGKPIALGGGSGLIVDSKGLILTNAHTVHKPNIRIMVKLYNGDVIEGLVDAIDERGDLATIRINRTNLPSMKFGNSDNIKPGEFVVAMGSPLSLANSITFGVVSNPGRHSHELRLFDVNMKYIQTDASITYGNSGGPLVNLNGEVIGVNVLKFTPGISFAIPINYVKQFLQNVNMARKGNYSDGIKILLKNEQSIKRKFLGITMLSLTPDLIQTLREHGTIVPATINHGILIWKVYRGSPAEKEGIKPGDIITYINENPALTTDDIYNVLQKSEKILIRLLRNGTEFIVKVKPSDIQ